MKYLTILGLLFGCFTQAQTDFSGQWKDLFSYNEVKDFTISESNILYAITENAVFIYDIDENLISKFSSVNGLSGNFTSAISYDTDTNNVLVGYENGLLEIIKEDNTILPVTGLRDNLIELDKSINGISIDDQYVYVYGGFGISKIDVDKVEFRETFKLSVDVTSNVVNDVLFDGTKVYAATQNGLYSCDVSLDISLFSNWVQVTNNSVSNLEVLNSIVYFSVGSSLFQISAPTVAIYTNADDILDISVDYENAELAVLTTNQVDILNLNDFSVSNEIDFSNAADYSINPTRGCVFEGKLFVNSNKNGILTTLLEDENIGDNIAGVRYTEIHPSGPSVNGGFTITANDRTLWLTQGGYQVAGAYGRLENVINGVDYFDGSNWEVFERAELGNIADFTRAIRDPKNINRVLISTYNEGVVELEGDVFSTIWNDLNTNDLIPFHRDDPSINWEADLIVDNNNNIWSANARGFNNELFSKFDGGLGEWTNKVAFSLSGNNNGINKMFKDDNNNIYAGTRFHGLLIFNANDVDNEIDRSKAQITTGVARGFLPTDEVLCGVVDNNNRIWIGTPLGLVVLDDYNNIFNNEISPVQTIIIEEDGEAKELLTDIRINDIVIDHANNIWVATHTSGVFHLSSDGQTTFNIFNTSNSPLPSDTILDLEIDSSTGLLYIVTALGVLEYDSLTEPFSDNITEIVAYPNPVISNQVGHNVVSIVAKNGEGLPEGANVKILDVSGKLVFEHNIANDGSSAAGGKLVWDKNNLAGNPVVSGIYIVLVSSSDGTENTSTKIAILN